MVTLAPLIVVADEPLAPTTIEQAVLKLVHRPFDGIRHLPNLHLHHRLVVIQTLEMDDQVGSHPFLWCRAPYGVNENRRVGRPGGGGPGSPVGEAASALSGPAWRDRMSTIRTEKTAP